jgi:hypothetical protein
MNKFWSLTIAVLLGSVIVTSLQHIVRTEGFRGMYRGLSPTILALLPNWAVSFFYRCLCFCVVISVCCSKRWNAALDALLFRFYCVLFQHSHVFQLLILYTQTTHKQRQDIIDSHIINLMSHHITSHGSYVKPINLHIKCYLS